AADDDRQQAVAAGGDPVAAYQHFAALAADAFRQVRLGEDLAEHEQAGRAHQPVAPGATHAETRSRRSCAAGHEWSNCQPCCAWSRVRNASSISADGVTTHLAGKRARKLDATSTHSPIACTRASPMQRPCSQRPSCSKYAGTSNWR